MSKTLTALNFKGSFVRVFPFSLCVGRLKLTVHSTVAFPYGNYFYVILSNVQ